MPRAEYLRAAVPETEKAVRPADRTNAEDRLLALEERLDRLNELLVKQQRDEKDRYENIDETMLSESLLRIINDLQARVAALEAPPDAP